MNSRQSGRTPGRHEEKGKRDQATAAREKTRIPENKRRKPLENERRGSVRTCKVWAVESSRPARRRARKWAMQGTRDVTEISKDVIKKFRNGNFYVAEGRGDEKIGLTRVVPIRGAKGQGLLEDLVSVVVEQEL
jgi:hypothetical protein